jgi:glycosyltransferase involved in cell wall biosynthesis
MVSVGMPLYNAERFVRGAVDSILSQTFTDFELIISDNASTDATAAICEAYAAEDPRVRFVRNQRNLGAAQNFNAVFALSSGRYFKWAAADDTCHPTFLERCVEVLGRHPEVVIAYPRTQVIDDEGGTLEVGRDTLRLDSPDIRDRFADVLSPLRYTNYPFYGLIRRGALQRTRLMVEYLAADRCLLAELSLFGRFEEIGETLFCRRKSRNGRDGAGKELAYNRGGKPVKYLFPAWRVLLEHHRSVIRSPLPMRMKSELIGIIWRWATANRVAYRYDITRNLHTLFGKRTAR